MIKVSDHAVLRYLERVQGISVETAREFIADQCQGQEEYKSGTVFVGAGHYARITNGVVVTVVKKNKRFHPEGKLMQGAKGEAKQAKTIYKKGKKLHNRPFKESW